MGDKKRVELVKHAGVFVDFWLGVAGAGAQGLAEAIGKPSAANATDKTPRELVEEAVDRTAKGLRVALEGARSAAQSAERELAQIHGTVPHAPSAPQAVMDAASKLSSHPPKQEREQILHDLVRALRNDNGVDASKAAS